ncbi:MAG: transglycosylase SLT domain-containing protein [Gemmatimonadetes bacterium]|nr:transglycosylase SLT domain-containing protein [Gemmatimonadota bacterium]
MLTAATVFLGPSAFSGERSEPATRVVKPSPPAANAAERRDRRYAERYGIDMELARLVVEQSKRAGVNPEIAFGLIAVESGFDARAVGRNGELGLMQIKLSTARAYERGVTSSQLFRPEVNLRIGLAHLKRETEHFGDRSLGLLAYNMGRGRLSRILKAGRRPSADYASQILARCVRDCG